MAPSPGFDSRKTLAAGAHVEVVDASNKLHRKIGIVKFWVADNIYVKFPDVRWSPTKMFFPDQLHAAAAPKKLPGMVSAAMVLRAFGSRFKRRFSNKRDR